MVSVSKKGPRGQTKLSEKPKNEAGCSKILKPKVEDHSTAPSNVRPRREVKKTEKAKLLEQEKAEVEAKTPKKVAKVSSKAATRGVKKSEKVEEAQMGTSVLPRASRSRTATPAMTQQFCDGISVGSSNVSKPTARRGRPNKNTEKIKDDSSADCTPSETSEPKKPARGRNKKLPATGSSTSIKDEQKDSANLSAPRSSRRNVTRSNQDKLETGSDKVAGDTASAKSKTRSTRGQKSVEAEPVHDDQVVQVPTRTAASGRRATARASSTSRATESETPTKSSSAKTSTRSKGKTAPIKTISVPDESGRSFPGKGSGRKKKSTGFVSKFGITKESVFLTLQIFL